jgi:glutamine synthetase
VTGEPYSRDPRQIAIKAANYLKLTGIADTAYLGPEAEFFVFDEARFDQNAHEGYYHLGSREGEWTRGNGGEPNLAYKLRHKEGYFPCPPADQLMDVRGQMVQAMLDCGLDVEAHHHEVATAGQCEIDMRFQPLVKMADWLMVYKHCVRNVARRERMTATFMPKPLFGDNGSGMHVHFSFWKKGEPLFAGGSFAGLSEVGLHARDWRCPAPRARTPGADQSNDQQLQAAGAWIRGAGESRVFAAQSLGRMPHSDV